MTYQDTVGQLAALGYGAYPIPRVIKKRGEKDRNIDHWILVPLNAGTPLVNFPEFANINDALKYAQQLR